MLLSADSCSLLNLAGVSSLVQSDISSLLSTGSLLLLSLVCCRRTGTAYARFTPLRIIIAYLLHLPILPRTHKTTLTTNPPLKEKQKRVRAECTTRGCSVERFISSLLSHQQLDLSLRNYPTSIYFNLPLILATPPRTLTSSTTSLPCLCQLAS